MSLQQTFSVTDLLQLMKRLRDPEHGCPWDIKQTYQSITPSTIEEAYEVVDAIDHGDFAHLREELGDLLFQVVFYSQMAEEDSHFNFANVVDGLTDKLIRRHPHVFPDGTLNSRVILIDEQHTAETVKHQWENIKVQERQQKGRTGLLDDVPAALPALSRALKLQKRAAQVGFDWSALSPVLVKVREELAELEQAVSQADDEAIAEELGDLLFSVVNLTRHLKRDPEQILRSANQKFTRRFEFIERSLAERGAAINPENQELMEQLWAEAKAAELK